MVNLHIFFSSVHTAGWLLWVDLYLFLKNWKDNILDAFFWPVVIILSNGYVMPAMGLPSDYGAFNVASMLIIMASFTAWSAANIFAADFEGARSIGYELTLPLPYWMIYLKIIAQFAVKAAFFNLITIVIGKAILWNTFSFAYFSMSKFLVLYILANLFFGAFALWAACLAGNVKRFMHLELRIAGPLFFICGYSFPFKILYQISPLMGKLMLLTPWIYAYEGLRVAMFGQEGYLPFWICIGMLKVFTLIFTAHGLMLFKKRLDCV